MMISKIVGIALVLTVIVLYEWPKLESRQRKERNAFVLISAIGGGMLALILFFPELPGPNQWMTRLFKPMSWILEK